MVSHWNLGDSNCPPDSKTFLSILADLNNAVVWMDSTRTLISKRSSPCTNPLVTVPRTLLLLLLFWQIFHTRTLLSILANLYSTVVWINLTLSLISNSYGLFSRPSGPFQVHRLQLIIQSSSCSTYFSALLKRSRYLYILSCSSVSILSFAETAKYTK